MSTVEKRKKERFKKILDRILMAHPLIAVSTVVNKKALNLLKGTLTKEKEFDLNQLIKDLKSEEKLSKGDRGAAESIPKKDFERSVFISKVKKRMKKATPAGKQYKGIQSPEIEVAKGGKIKTYAKGGGVRKPKMTGGY